MKYFVENYKMIAYSVAMIAYTVLVYIYLK